MRVNNGLALRIAEARKRANGDCFNIAGDADAVEILVLMHGKNAARAAETQDAVMDKNKLEDAKRAQALWCWSWKEGMRAWDTETKRFFRVSDIGAFLSPLREELLDV